MSNFFENLNFRNAPYRCTCNVYKLCMILLPMYYIDFETYVFLISMGIYTQSSKKKSYFFPKDKYVDIAVYLLSYEGRSICNENSPVYPKVLYLHTS